MLQPDALEGGGELGRLFSLRGKLDVADNGVTANHPILDYVSPDRTKAWKVKEAYVWPVEWFGVAIGGPGFLTCVAKLSTDTAKYNQNQMVDPSENRAFAFAQQTYNHRDDNVHFVTPNGVPLGNMRFLVDPDSLVTKGLYINICTATDVDVTNVREWGFMIILEEQKVSPQESLFQQIKGMAQDIADTF